MRGGKKIGNLSTEKYSYELQNGLGTSISCVSLEFVRKYVRIKYIKIPVDVMIMILNLLERNDKYSRKIGVFFICFFIK